MYQKKGSYEVNIIFFDKMILKTFWKFYKRM